VGAETGAATKSGSSILKAASFSVIFLTEARKLLTIVKRLYVVFVLALELFAQELPLFLLFWVFQLLSLVVEQLIYLFSDDVSWVVAIQT
jgi:hypothetical protein